MTEIIIDDKGFVRLDGVPIGKGFIFEGRPILQVKDKDPRRCSERGSLMVAVDLYQLAAFVDSYGSKSKPS